MVRFLSAPVFAAAMIIASTSQAQEQAGQGSPSTPAAGPAAASLSKNSLKWLAGGVALYPDPVLEKVLEAAQTPGAVHQAAGALGSPGGRVDSVRLPESVAFLARSYPDTLRAMDSKPGLMGRLGREFHQNPAQVWSAINEFRQEIAARKTAGPDGTPAAASDEEASQAASQAIAGPETQAQLADDESATAPSVQTVVPAPSATTVVPAGGTTVVGGPAYPAAYGYSAGYYPSGVGGYVRRGWYGHGAFNGAGASGWSNNSRWSNWSHHGGLYDHADAGRVNAANRSLSRNWSGLHHGEHEHTGHHDADHHHSSEHHGDHHSAEHRGGEHGGKAHGGEHRGGEHRGGHGGGHHGGKGGHHGGGHRGGRR